MFRPSSQPAPGTLGVETSATPLGLASVRTAPDDLGEIQLRSRQAQEVREVDTVMVHVGLARGRERRVLLFEGQKT